MFHFEHRLLYNSSRSILCISVCFSLFSCRSEVSKSLEIDAVLRNFTVFEYLKNKVRPATYHAPLSVSVSKAPLRQH